MNNLHLIALGANLPAPDGASPRASCERALRFLAALPQVTGLVRSRWYSSAALPPSGQPRYINGVVALLGNIPPAELLAALHHHERVSGRLRGEANAARTLDLDIIDSMGLVRDAPDPILPHPRAHLRAFVLLPLRDVAPNWIHPRLRRSVQDLLIALPPQDIRFAGSP